MSKIASSKFAWMAGAALALTAATVADGAAHAPVPPAPPALPEAPANGQHIVIVEKHGDIDGHEYVRTVTRDGKTYTFQTDKALSEAELERRIASAEAGIAPLDPVAPVIAGPHPGVKRRVIVLNQNGQRVTDVATVEGDSCIGKDVVSNVDTSSEADGQLTRVRVQMCDNSGEIGKQAKADAATGIAEARAEIARDMDLPEAARKKAIQELDAELARLKRES